MEYVPARHISLKAHPVYNEKWLQNLIADDPTVLGLGELSVREAERRQPRAGRLDLLLSDPVLGTRYEVEIQLGSTDESHIIRTVEYWDIERTRFPQYDHVAVLVAEDITSRFLNVIGLFNKAIPIIAIQLNAFEVGGQFTVSATTVLNLMRRGTDEEDEPGPATDRAYWDARSTPAVMAIVDQLTDLIHAATGESSIGCKYNKGYIGLARNGVADNFIYFLPRKKFVLAEFRLDRSDELENRLEQAGVEMANPYNPRSGRYALRLTDADVSRNRDLFLDMIRTAADMPALAEE